MCCEHLSNCHGELTIAATMGATLLLWLRMGWSRVKMYCCLHLGGKKHQADCHDHSVCDDLDQNHP